MTEIQEINSPENATHEIILNNNLGTPQSEKVFQYLASIYAKHNSRLVDDAVMFYVTSIIADLISEIVKDEKRSLGDDEELHAPFDTLIIDETYRYKQIISKQILKYLQTSPKIADVDSKIKIQESNEISDLNFPSYMGVCPSNLAEVFNWENSRHVQCKGNVFTEETAEKRENIYDLVLKDLDYLDCLLNDDVKIDEEVTFIDVLNAFARYQLYRHTYLHRLYYNNIEMLVKIFSEFYSVNLQSRFVKCSCCGEISRDKETTDAIN